MFGLIFRAVVVASQEKRVVGSLAVENRWVQDTLGKFRVQLA
jgi:hypothetical protein